MKSGLTEIIVILDRSGSMQSCCDDMRGALDKFVCDQRSIEGEARFTFVRFDNIYEKVYDNIPLDQVGPLTLEPRGTTALLDAIGRTLNSVGERLRDTPEDARPEHVIVCVITDGHENASSEFTRKQVFDMVREQTDVYNWIFTFLGADIDTFAEAGSLGIPLSNSLSYNKSKDGVSNMAGSLCHTVTTVRTTGNTVGYSTKDREDAMK